jgi:tetratricopeptide (TPR) repeat protein
MCQWANAYNISQEDLKSIIATFRSVFPDGTVWLVGGDDVLLLATADPLGPALGRMSDRMSRPEVASDLASIGVLDAFSIASLQVGEASTLAAFTAGSQIFTDDHLPLEFTAPRELHNPRAGENGAALRRLLTLKIDVNPNMAVHWHNRAAMLAGADHHELAIEDYLAALTIDPHDAIALEGLVKSALITRKSGEVLKRLSQPHPDETAQGRIARSKLLAADGRRDEAIALAREAATASPLGTEQLASLFADSGDTVQLDAAVAELRRVAPNRAPTEYYSAAAAFLHGDANEAVARAERAIAIDHNYAPTYDLVGAAYTKLNQLDQARQAFQKSLAFDAHDSTAYENLGVLELNAGNRNAAAKYFAEALWLVPESAVSREGLRRARTGSP